MWASIYFSKIVPKGSERLQLSSLPSTLPCTWFYKASLFFPLVTVVAHSLLGIGRWRGGVRGLAKEGKRKVTGQCASVQKHCTGWRRWKNRISHQRQMAVDTSSSDSRTSHCWSRAASSLKNSASLVQMVLLATSSWSKRGSVKRFCLRRKKLERNQWVLFHLVSCLYLNDEGSSHEVTVSLYKESSQLYLLFTFDNSLQDSKNDLISTNANGSISIRFDLAPSNLYSTGCYCIFAYLQYVRPFLNIWRVIFSCQRTELKLTFNTKWLTVSSSISSDGRTHWAAFLRNLKKW